MQLTLSDEIHIRRTLPTPEDARSIREAAGVSQEQVARAVGVTRVTVSRWETGERRPRGGHVVRYSNALDLMRGALADQQVRR